MTETTPAAVAPAPAAPAAEAPKPAIAATAPAPEVDKPEGTLLDTKAPDKPARTAADYKLTAPEGVDDKALAAVAEWAASKNLPPEAAQAVLERDAERAKAEQVAHAEQKQKWADALKAQHTPDALHDLDTRVTAFVRQQFGDEIAKWLKDSGVIAHPKVFAGFAALASRAKEGGMVKAATPTGATMSPGKRDFPRSPINWSAAERAEWEAAGSPKL